MGLLWMWIASLVFSVVIAIISKKYVAFCITAASVLSVILHFCKLELVWQVVAFLLSALVFILSFILFKSKFAVKLGEALSFESVVGERCVVVEKIDNFAGCGLVKIHSQLFSARGTEDSDVFEIGEVLHIVAIEGVKLICRK